MPDASNQTYSPNALLDWSLDPRETDSALDELAGTRQRGLFDAYDAVGGQAVTGSAVTVNIDTTRTTSSSAVFVLSSDQLTVNLTGGGLADISYRATLGNTGSDDFSFDIYLEQAPASTGVFAEVTGSRLKGGKGT